MKSYKKTAKYWEAWWVITLSKILGVPKYKYKWWETRLRLIKTGKI